MYYVIKILRFYNLLAVDISLNNGAFVQVLHMDKFRVYHFFDKSLSIIINYCLRFELQRLKFRNVLWFQSQLKESWARDSTLKLTVRT